MLVPRSEPAALVFTATDSAWPFDDSRVAGGTADAYRANIPKHLEYRLLAWGQYRLDLMDRASGLFPSDAERGRFDREYFALIDELLPLGFDFAIDMWW